MTITSGLFSLVMRWAATAILVTVAVVAGAWLWASYSDDPWTRDGHVRADVVRVAPDVGGLVTSVAVRDNQRVAKGQLLFVVDLPRYTDSLARTDDAVASARATLEQAKRVFHRDAALGDLVAAEVREADGATVSTALATLASALAMRRTAALDVQRTQVHASVNGIVTNLDLHPGDFAAQGAQAMALIDTDSVRVEGYFEETRLRAIAVGDGARVTLMGDARPMWGHVDSFAGGIADDQNKPTPNQLPAITPTFSWVRLAQRIPVRIHIDRMPADIQLIPGRTATITVLPGSRHR